MNPGGAYQMTYSVSWVRRPGREIYAKKAYVYVSHSLSNLEIVKR